MLLDFKAYNIVCVWRVCQVCMQIAMSPTFCSLYHSQITEIIIRL